MARLTPIAFNPTMLFVAAATMNINMKLADIQRTQTEMFDYLKQKNKAELRGQLKTLNDVWDDYKYNQQNDNFKSSRHVQIRLIKENSESNILFYRGKIEKDINKTAKRIGSILSDFREYQLAVYLYAFSSLLDVLFLENFGEEFLNKTVQRIDDYSYQYRELYSACYTQLKKEIDSSIQAHLLGGLAKISNAAGTVVERTPIGDKSQIDETLLAAGNKIGNYVLIKQIIHWKNFVI